VEQFTNKWNEGLNKALPNLALVAPSSRFVASIVHVIGI
jgi:hypothetical protein